ncbi:hypothetical protein, partial [Chryseobacterium sp. Leaf405]|uniref:hypothetical protein n=1 Tax=Chryseobacterium sp. Leaf405 TaxID=1736367 RepID=UPI001EE74E57
QELNLSNLTPHAFRCLSRAHPYCWVTISIGVRVFVGINKFSISLQISADVSTIRASLTSIIFLLYCWDV